MTPEKTRAELIAEIEALKKQLEWQPIETAPRDVVTEFLVTDGVFVVVGWGTNTGNIYIKNDDGDSCPIQKKATHWMPLQSPPEIIRRIRND